MHNLRSDDKRLSVRQGAAFSWARFRTRPNSDRGKCGTMTILLFFVWKGPVNVAGNVSSKREAEENK